VNPGWVCELVPWEAPEAPIAQYWLKAAKTSIVHMIYKKNSLPVYLSFTNYRLENLSRTFT